MHSQKPVGFMDAWLSVQEISKWSTGLWHKSTRNFSGCTRKRPKQGRGGCLVLKIGPDECCKPSLNYSRQNNHTLFITALTNKHSHQFLGMVCSPYSTYSNDTETGLCMLWYVRQNGPITAAGRMHALKAASFHQQKLERLQCMFCVHICYAPL